MGEFRVIIAVLFVLEIWSVPYSMSFLLYPLSIFDLGALLAWKYYPTMTGGKRLIMLKYIASRTYTGLFGAL